ncbi:MAG: YqaE/Pmp3 family membrane protein [Hyphomonas sp.]|nr:YqaE/Pmp3 family membrane protein [Hyphomonas sp.]
MSLVMILLVIFLPPVAVAVRQGIGLQLLINIVLTLIGWVPGVIHALWVVTREPERLDWTTQGRVNR